MENATEFSGHAPVPSRWWRVLTRGALAAPLLALLALPAGNVTAGADPPSATSASITSHGVLLVESRRGTESHLSISKSGRLFVVEDLDTPILAGARCRSSPLLEKAVCRGPVRLVKVVLSNGPDSLRVSLPVPVRAYGGRGSDTLRASAGQTASVTFDGGPGNDLLYGGPSSDVLTGGHGHDTISGGAGRDTVSYRGRTTPVHVTLDGLRGNDGGAGERDTVRADVENIDGTLAADILIGSDVDNRIRGFGGRDLIRGLKGNDYLTGGSGDDFIFGGKGKDAMSGNEGADYLGGMDGTKGNDQMDGGNQSDICTGDARDTRKSCERWR